MRLLAVEPVSPFLLQNRGAPMSGPSFSISGKPVTVTPTAITNGVTFWPDLDLAEFQKVRTLPADLPPETAGVALLAAIAEVNDALADVVTYWNAKACERAADVPGAKMGDETQLTAQYKKSGLRPRKGRFAGGSSPPSGGVNRIRGRKAWTPAPACWPRRPT
ncbi:putative Head completion/stabilization protein (GpL) from bacteriophage origin [Escherichia coli]|uniref:Putative Head completion/stabilization protein (GpL) from bacteriophage origin n=1 Tax=Escherichia coli TaxID=562 RepID=A0A2X3JKL9_ECOLX|nr:putative Head completion/stabilization protein (GpL) from bacteriophage origin [Escherichia coli]